MSLLHFLSKSKISFRVGASWSQLLLSYMFPSFCLPLVKESNCFPLKASWRAKRMDLPLYACSKLHAATWPRTENAPVFPVKVQKTPTGNNWVFFKHLPTLQGRPIQETYISWSTGILLYCSSASFLKAGLFWISSSCFSFSLDYFVLYIFPEYLLTVLLIVLTFFH